MEFERNRSDDTAGKSHVNCCVPQCTSTRGREKTLSFHKFPHEKEKVTVNDDFGGTTMCGRRKEWVRRLRIGKPISSFMVVCSRHFTEGDFNFGWNTAQRKRLKCSALPSTNLPVLSTSATTVTVSRKAVKRARMERCKQRQMKRQACDTPCQEGTNLDDGMTETEVYIPEQEEQAEPLRPFEEDSMNESTFPAFADKCIQVFSYVPTCFEVTDEKSLQKMTGLHSLAMLNDLAEGLKQLQLNRYNQNLSEKQKILLTMIKMKQNIRFAVLSTMFRCSASTCQNVFKSTTAALADLLQCAIPWPSKEEIISNMPKCFSKYKETRIVLDCIEVAVARPGCLKCRIKTYSHYKGGQTIKYLIGVSPAGLITFVSSGYSGRASDKKVFEESGLIDKLEPFLDAVMVDKGFLIDNVCNDNFIKLIRPPFLRKNKQFSKQEALYTKDVASARVHVEKVIQRIKIFAIFKSKLPWTLLPSSDHLFRIAAALANLSTPVLGDDKF